jgi:hypothetical protein
MGEGVDRAVLEIARSCPDSEVRIIYAAPAFANFGIEDTSNSIIIVPPLNRKFASNSPHDVRELRFGALAGTAPALYSALIFAARMTLAHVSISVLMRIANSSGVLATTS